MDAAAIERMREIMVGSRAQQFDFLKHLVRLPSENPPGQGAAHAEHTGLLLEDLGFQVERHPVPPELCERRGVASIINLVVRHRFGDGPVLALQANGDTAPAGKGWKHDAFGASIEDGVMYGRGAVASKGDIAAFAFAAHALVEAAPDGLAGTLELHITYDGESGGRLGPEWLLDNEVVAPDMVIGGGLTHAIVTHSNGYMQLDVELRGLSAPAFRSEDGRDALEVASKLMTTLYGLRLGYANTVSEVPGCGSPKLLIGGLQGGGGIGKVPDNVVLNIGRRLIPDEDPEAVERQLTNVIGNTVAKTSGVLCRIRRPQMMPPMTPTEGTQPMIDALSRHCEAVTGEAPGTRGLPWDADGRHYARRGIPTVLYGAGPADPAGANIGGAEEHLDLDDLRKGTEVVALAIADLLTPQS